MCSNFAAMSTSFIDSDFVLNSTQPNFTEKPLVLTNSQMTSTTRNLAYNTNRLYSPGQYTTSTRRVTSPTLASVLRRSMSPSELKKSLQETTDRSRSRSRQRFESFNNRLQRSRSSSPIRGRSRSPSPNRTAFRAIVRSDSENSIDQELDDANFKEKLYRPTSHLSTWATNPIHLTNSTDPGSLRNSIRMSRRRSRSPDRLIQSRNSSLRRGRSRSPSAELRSLATSSMRLYEEFPLTGLESMAKNHFPVTMNAYKIEHIDPPLSRSMTTSPPPKHMRPKPEHKWRADGKVNHIIKGRDLKRSSYKDIDDISKMYTMTDVAPSIAAGTVHMISPYAGELASLRLDRLKIEEEHLLEAKRLAEIERLRGPKPKWYELKTPDFHYEAHKNNELVASKDRWRDMIDYRKSVNFT